MTDEIKSLILGLHEDIKNLASGMTRLALRIDKLEKDYHGIVGKVDGLGENIWEMKEKKEWAAVPKAINDIKLKELKERVEIGFPKLQVYCEDLINKLEKKYAKADEDVWEFLKKVSDIEGILKELLKAFGSWFFLNKEEYMKKSKAMQELCYNLMHKVEKPKPEVLPDAVDALAHAVGRITKRVKSEVVVKIEDLEVWEYNLSRVIQPTPAVKKTLKSIKRYLDENRIVQVRLNS